MQQRKTNMTAANGPSTGTQQNSVWPLLEPSLLFLFCCLTISVQFLITQNLNEQVRITGLQIRIKKIVQLTKIIRLHSLYRIPSSFIHWCDQHHMIHIMHCST
jgi:hypothetical protein